MNAKRPVSYIKRIKYKVKWRGLFGPLMSAGVLLTSLEICGMILYRIYGIGEVLASFRGYNEEAGYYFLINRLYNNGEGIKNLWLLFATSIVVILVIVFVLLKTNAKRKLLIIEHSSLQKMGFSYKDEDLEDYAYKTLPINQYGILNSEDISTHEKVSTVITEIDCKVPKILNYVGKGYQIGYAGIANIPATFMLGYELGDENKKLLFHKRRDNSTDDKFHLLKDEKRALKFISNTIENDPTKDGKILILIALTQPIKDADLQNVQEKNDYVIKYEIPQTINYDVVDSADQINKYTNKILADISEVQKNPNISEIKICVAASGAFVFALGAKFSETQNKDTVIFHYQKDSYPWGINTMEKKVVEIKGSVRE